MIVVDATVLDWTYHAIRWTWHDPDGYNFISGPLADITLLGGAYAIFRRHNCHAKGCWRVGRHKVPGTDYIVCRKHHPHESPSAEQILAEHHAAKHAGTPPAPPGPRVQPDPPPGPPLASEPR